MICDYCNEIATHKCNNHLGVFCEACIVDEHKGCDVEGFTELEIAQHCVIRLAKSVVAAQTSAKLTEAMDKLEDALLTLKGLHGQKA